MLRKIIIESHEKISVFDILFKLFALN